MHFEWDEKKAVRNLSVHGVPFDEAKTAFDDPLFLIAVDPEHSIDERRYVIMGESNVGRLLVIAYTERAQTIRLISARLATRKERQSYEQEI